jgi:hypothetical protein
MYVNFTYNNNNNNNNNIFVKNNNFLLCNEFHAHFIQYGKSIYGKKNGKKVKVWSK